MSDEPKILTLDECAIIGARAKIAARKLNRDLANWDLFRRTFGFFQWKNKNKLTPEQLAAFEDGFKNLTIKSK